MCYLVRLCVHFKEGVLNPEAEAIQEGCKQLGFDLSDLVWGRYCSYVSSQPSKKAVLEEAESICGTLFANPVMEAYEILSVKRIGDDGGRRG
ncbi:phosphoribosylformylglycinamidine synthase subunit PurS [Candidatus Woesearchaeota archaeon]|nr:phosphoribosylformylglycinamidine synthase subunit PurS [Candidatus Woesearchaeota archaeon]